MLPLPLPPSVFSLRWNQMKWYHKKQKISRLLRERSDLGPAVVPTWS